MSFTSLQINRYVAQMAEQGTLNPQVAGSMPVMPTKALTTLQACISYSKQKKCGVTSPRDTTKEESVIVGAHVITKWGLGLQGVVICFANRKSDEFDSRNLHQVGFKNK